MPLQRLNLRPGVNRETTNYANEGGFFVSDKVRFRGGNAQKIGGWQNIVTSVSTSENTYKGVARYLFNYVTTLSQNLLAVLTNQKIYMNLGNDYYDITPIRKTETLGSDPISTTDGSRLVTITSIDHGTSIGTFVNITGATAVGGVTISGDYEVIGVPSGSTFTIISSTAATSTATGGGASVVAIYDISAGPATYTTGVGWGGPAWGFGGWGSNIPVGLPIRLWSGVNYGDDFIFGQREGDVYYWTKDTNTWARAVTLETKADATPKVITTATFASGSTTIVVSNATGINTGSVISGSGIPTGAFVTTAWNGGVSVTISTATTGSGTVSVAASYAGRHAPDKVLSVIDSPVNDFIICLGSKPYDPTNFDTVFDPLIVRWSDQENPTEWVPEVTNQSGEQRLSNGSFIMTGVSTRQEIVLFTDTAVYSMQYLGPPFVWGFNLLDQDISIASPNSVISVNNSVYWMGTDKFFVYDGRVQTLPCSVRQYVFGTLDRSQISQVMCGHNEPFSEIWWYYPGTGSYINNLYVSYNYLEGVWTYGSLERSAYAQQTTRDYPLLAFGIQSSFLDTSINSSITSISLLNGTSYPSSGVITIDSEKIFYGSISGNTLLECVRGYENTTAASHDQYTEVNLEIPNQVMFHEIGNDDLSLPVAKPISCFVETSDFDIGDGEQFSFVWRIIPDMKFAGSTASSPSVTLTLKPHNYPGAAYGTGDNKTVTASTVLPVEQYTEQVFTRIRGRQLAFRVASSDLGVAWQMGAMRLDIRPDGRR
jgi:hypothetical protein